MEHSGIIMTVIKDALYNMSPDSKTSADHARGIFIGVMAATMGWNNLDFGPALKLVAIDMPTTVMRDAVPLSWRGQVSVLGITLVGE
jgi:hypothetical protein